MTEFAANLRHYPLAGASPASNTLPHFGHFISSVLTRWISAGGIEEPQDGQAVF